MKKTLFVFLLALLVFGGTFAATPPIGGKWRLTMQSPMGERCDDMTVAQEGEKLTVTIQSPRGEQTYQGTIKESAVTWSGKRLGPNGMEFVVVYAGKLDKDALKGTVQMGDRGTFEWSAARAK